MTGTRHAVGDRPEQVGVEARRRSRRGRSRSRAARRRRGRRPARPRRRRRGRSASRPPLTTTSQAGLGRSAPAGVDGDDDRLAPEPARRSGSTSVGSATAAVLSETLSAPARSTSRISSTRAHAAADGQRDERPPRGPLDDVEERAAALRRGGDVEEDELVGALARRSARRAPAGRPRRRGRRSGSPLTTRPSATSRQGMTRRRSIRRRPARRRRRGEPTKLASSRRPSSPLRSGWNWTPSERGRAPRPTRTGAPCSVVGEDRVARAPPAGRAGVRVDEVEVGAVGDAVEQRMVARPLDLVPADVRQGRGVLEARRSGRAARRASSRRPRRCPRTAAGARGRCPRNGRSAAIQAADRRRRGRGAPGGPSPAPRPRRPGTTSASAPRSRLAVARDRDVGARRSSAPARC